MPRQPRIDAPGALHHIICRGIERRRIFLDDVDRDKFVARLGEVLLKTSTRCFAWALIPNHFHLLLTTGTLPVASVMERVLTGYAGDFNRRHKRHGHLFQNRYKSILCQSDPYLLELVRYIHLNPLRAGVVSSIEDLGWYPYTGNCGLVSGKAPAWQSTDEVLARFGESAATGRQGYEDFLADGVGMGRRADLIGGGLVRSAGGWENVSLAPHLREHLKSDERILGDSDFVEEVLNYAQEQIVKASLLHSRGVDLDHVAQRVAELLQIEFPDVWREGRRAITVQARSLLCYWAMKELGMTAAAIGKRIGVSEPTVLRSAERGAQLAKQNGWNLLPTL